MHDPSSSHDEFCASNRVQIKTVYRKPRYERCNFSVLRQAARRCDLFVDAKNPWLHVTSTICQARAVREISQIFANSRES